MQAATARGQQPCPDSQCGRCRRTVPPLPLLQAGNTALHHAATAGNLAVVQRLLAHANGAASQATPNAKGRTPLHQAAVFGHRSIVEALAQKQRADLTAQDEVHAQRRHACMHAAACPTLRRVPTH